MNAILTSSILLALAGSTLAEPPERKERPKHEPNEEMLNHIFKRLDTDKSGRISQAEFEANPRLERASEEQKKKLFARLDKNSDEELERHELRPEKALERRNWQSNGPLSFEQFIEQPRIADLPPEVQQDIFKRMDRNDDGVINKEDSRRFREGEPGRPKEREKGRMNGASLAEIDTNRDGQITFEEFQKAPRQREFGEDELEDRFEKLDRNGDQVLSPEDRPREDRPPKERPPAEAPAADDAPPLF